MSHDEPPLTHDKRETNLITKQEKLNKRAAEHRLELVYRLAKQFLQRGPVRLGPLVEAIIDADGTGPGVTTDEVRAFYEMTLYRLEQELGPLRCAAEDDEDCERCWGYSDVFVDGEPNEFRCYRIAPAANAWSLRIGALHGGHPDAQIAAGECVPTTVWRRAA